jgi:hypothetical protein
MIGQVGQLNEKDLDDLGSGRDAGMHIYIL